MAKLYLFTLWKHEGPQPDEDEHDYGWAGYRMTDDHVPDCFEPIPADEAPLDDIIEALDHSQPCPQCMVLDKEFVLVDSHASLTVQEWAIHKLREEHDETRPGFFYYLDDPEDPTIF